MRLLSDVEDLLGMGEQVSTVHPQHRLQQALHLDARAASIQPERGFQHGFIVSQEGLEDVRHNWLGQSVVRKKSNPQLPFSFDSVEFSGFAAQEREWIAISCPRRCPD